MSSSARCLKATANWHSTVNNEVVLRFFLTLTFGSLDSPAFRLRLARGLVNPQEQIFVIACIGGSARRKSARTHSVKGRAMFHQSSNSAASVLALAFVAAAMPTVRGQTWAAAGSGDWNTAANWSPATVPNSATATATFGIGETATVNMSSSVQLQSLSFSNSTGNYAVSSTFNATLTLASITLASGVTGFEDVNIDTFSSGINLIFSSGLTISNNSTSGGVLEIGPNTMMGSTGSGGMTVVGPGYTVLLGSITGTVSGGLTKTGTGEFQYTGSGASLAGGLTLNGGTLVMDYSTSTASKLAVGNGATGTLTLDGGELVMAANPGTAVSQTIPGGMIVNAGHTDISAEFTGTITLAAGAISHNFGGTADFNPSSAGRPDVHRYYLDGQYQRLTRERPGLRHRRRRKHLGDCRRRRHRRLNDLRHEHLLRRDQHGRDRVQFAPGDSQRIRSGSTPDSDPDSDRHEHPPIRRHPGDAERHGRDDHRRHPDGTERRRIVRPAV